MKKSKLKQFIHWYILTFTRYRFGHIKFNLMDIQEELNREFWLDTSYREHTVSLEYYITSTGIVFPNNTLPESAIITSFNLDAIHGQAQIGYCVRS